MTGQYGKRSTSGEPLGRGMSSPLASLQQEMYQLPRTFEVRMQ
jgi:hypothetical protein